MDPHCEPSVAMIRLTGVESVKTIPGGFIRITCKFGSPTIFGTTNTTGNETNPTTAADNPFTDATSTANSDASSDSAKYDPRKKKAITAPTYSMRGTLEELPIANHPKFKLLSFQEQAILGQLMSGELTISDDWTQVGRKERINVSFGNPYDKWIPLATSDGPVTLSTECLKFARRIAVGKTTYKSPSWLWVRKWEDSAGMTGDPLSPTGVYIPSDIQDCFRELDKMLAVSVRDEIRKNDEDDLSRYHFGLGMWIRNNWGLWIEESRLKQYFDSLGGDSRR